MKQKTTAVIIAALACLSICVWGIVRVNGSIPKDSVTTFKTCLLFEINQIYRAQVNYKANHGNYAKSINPLFYVDSLYEYEINYGLARYEFQLFNPDSMLILVYPKLSFKNEKDSGVIMFKVGKRNILEQLTDM